MPWISWFSHRWRTQRNAICHANCRIQWIIESLNANCGLGIAPRPRFREYRFLLQGICSFFLRRIDRAGPKSECLVVNERRVTWKRASSASIQYWIDFGSVKPRIVRVTSNCAPVHAIWLIDSIQCEWLGANLFGFLDRVTLMIASPLQIVISELSFHFIQETHRLHEKQWVVIEQTSGVIVRSQRAFCCQLEWTFDGFVDSVNKSIDRSLWLFTCGDSYWWIVFFWDWLFIRSFFY
jgi:hypothetical protein